MFRQPHFQKNVYFQPTKTAASSAAGSLLPSVFKINGDEKSNLSRSLPQVLNLLRRPVQLFRRAILAEHENSACNAHKRVFITERPPDCGVQKALDKAKFCRANFRRRIDDAANIIILRSSARCGAAAAIRNKPVLLGMDFFNSLGKFLFQQFCLRHLRLGFADRIRRTNRLGKLFQQ